MKKVIACLLLALALSVLLQRQVLEEIMNLPVIEGWVQMAQRTSGVQQTPEPDVPSVFRHENEGAAADMLDVTLYFRFAQTDVLGAQRAQLNIRREETIAYAIVEKLLEGPGTAYAQLSSVFPQETQVVSVSGEGRTAFVTLSKEFLGRPDGAPADWEDIPLWQEEAALRRRLAMQSLVLALTDGGRYQRVQLYVADGDDEIPQRVPMAWFDTTQQDAALLLAACARDEAALLTPKRAMEMILGAWQAQDWEMLYALTSADENGRLPAPTAFEAQMRETDVSLLDFAVTDGAVSFDGQTATLVVSASLRSTLGGDAQIERETVVLERSMDNWTIALSTLRSLMIRE